MTQQLDSLISKERLTSRTGETVLFKGIVGQLLSCQLRTTLKNQRRKLLLMHKLFHIFELGEQASCDFKKGSKQLSHHFCVLLIKINIFHPNI